MAIRQGGDFFSKCTLGICWEPRTKGFWISKCNQEEKEIFPISVANQVRERKSSCYVTCPQANSALSENGFPDTASHYLWLHYSFGLWQRGRIQDSSYCIPKSLKCTPIGTILHEHPQGCCEFMPCPGAGEPVRHCHSRGCAVVENTFA